MALAGNVEIRQITKTTLCENFQPTISGDGAAVAFLSDCQIIPGKNVDQNYEVFLYDFDKKTFTQITETTVRHATNQPAINDDGSRVAFMSTADLVSGKNADGNAEIFLFDARSGRLTQVTQTAPPVANSSPSLDGKGDRLLFLSVADLVRGGNLDGSVEAFLFERPKARFTQVTRIEAGPASPSGPTPPPISGAVLTHDGRKAVIVSTADLAEGTQTRGAARLFVYDVATKATRPVPATAGVGEHLHGPPVVNGDGSRIVVVSDASHAALAEPVGPDSGHAASPSARQGLVLLDAATGAANVLLEAGECGMQKPTIDAAGATIAFSSSCDFVGGNADFGLPNIEVFAVRVSTRAVTQITHTIRDFNHTPSIDRAGQRIAFGSDRDIHRGGNLDENSEIFVATLP